MTMQTDVGRLNFLNANKHGDVICDTHSMAWYDQAVSENVDRPCQPVKDMLYRPTQNMPYKLYHKCVMGLILNKGGHTGHCVKCHNFWIKSLSPDGEFLADHWLGDSHMAPLNTIKRYQCK